MPRVDGGEPRKTFSRKNKKEAMTTFEAVVGSARNL